MPTLHLVDNDSARAGPVDEAIIARFLLLGHDCVVVPLETAPMAGRTRLGSLTFDHQHYAVDGAPMAPAGPDPVERLTPRELEIALLIASGYCSKVIARRLHQRAYRQSSYRTGLCQARRSQARRAHCANGAAPHRHPPID